jgi:translation initiation factor 5
MLRFIEKYILCQVCKLPETTILAVKKNLEGHCRACGGTTRLDMTHRVATFIHKNVPKNMSEIVTKATVEVKKEKKPRGNDELGLDDFDELTQDSEEICKYLSMR